jgi:hypothetical protein
LRQTPGGAPRVRQIGAETQRTVAEFLGQLPNRAGGIEVVEHEVGSGAGDRSRGGRSDAAGGAGDQHHAVCKFGH